MDSPIYNFEYKYLLKVGGISREFWEILGKYRILDVGSLGSKGLKYKGLNRRYIHFHFMSSSDIELSFLV